MKYLVKISSTTNGIPITVSTKEQELSIVDSLLGKDGVRRITLECEKEPTDTKLTTYPKQDCAIVSYPVQDVTELLEAVSNGPPKVFTEIKATNEYSRGEFIDLQADKMGYHKLENGKIVITRGSTKVYTTIEAIKRLPHPVPLELIGHLSRPKQIAIKQFREWVHQDMPDTFIDPDEGFRQQLKPDTKPSNIGDFENTSGQYD